LPITGVDLDEPTLQLRAQAQGTSDGRTSTPSTASNSSRAASVQRQPFVINAWSSSMPLFSSKIEHLRALTEADGYANQALGRGEVPCLVVDADFFTKLGAGVAISNAQTIVADEAIGVLEEMVA